MMRLCAMTSMVPLHEVRPYHDCTELLNSSIRFAFFGLPGSKSPTRGEPRPSSLDSSQTPRVTDASCTKFPNPLDHGWPCKNFDLHT